MAASISFKGLGRGNQPPRFRVYRLAANIFFLGLGRGNQRNQRPVFGFIEWQPTFFFRV